MKNAADYYQDHEVDLYIETASGKKFYFSRPEFDIHDMAHAMGMQCRYTGHCRRFYSVAEHSILVADIMRHLDLGDPFEGLLHDGTEGYLSDIAAPWKALLPDYKRIEGELEVKLRRKYGLPATITPGCKRADWLALFVEARALMPTKAADWIAPEGVKEQAAGLVYPIHCMHPYQAKKIFLNHFYAMYRPAGKP